MSSLPRTAQAWLREPVSLELRLSLRLRAYAWAFGLTLASVPFLHLYIAVDLAPAELAWHTADIAGSVLAAAALLEGAVGLAMGGRDWHFRASRAGLGLAVCLGLAALVGLTSQIHDWLPATQAIRHKHEASGYGDMSLRVLPLTALIVWMVVQAVRRDTLARELAALRGIEEALRRRSRAEGLDGDSRTRAPAAAPPPLLLRHDGGETRVEVADVVSVRAQENYCEFALAPSGPGAEPARPWVRMTLAEARAQLPEARFVQTHRSCLANLDRVRGIRRHGRRCELLLQGGDPVPVSRGRLAEVRARVAGDPAVC